MRWVLLAAAFAVIGCERTRVSEPLATDYGEEATEADMQFWHGLADRSVVTNNGAFHALIALDKGGDPTDSYEARVEHLKKKGFLPEGFDRPANEAVRRGTVARILAPMLDIKGGVTMRLVGAHPRYALRALEHRDIMPPSSAQQALKGIEFVGIMAKAEDYAEAQ